MSTAPRIDEIGRIYEQSFPRFLRVATAVAGDAELGRDAVQEGFAQAIRRRADFRGTGTLEAWLWTIVVNAARSTRRDNRPLVALEEIHLQGSTNGSADEGLRSLIAGLPERQRLVLFLRYYADLDYEQIAEALAIRPGTVGATLNAAHGAIRRVLEGAASHGAASKGAA